jgi:hypothetical protein
MPIWQARFTTIKLAKHKSNITYVNFCGAKANLMKKIGKILFHKYKEQLLI